MANDFHLLWWQLYTLLGAKKFSTDMGTFLRLLTKIILVNFLMRLVGRLPCMCKGVITANVAILNNIKHFCFVYTLFYSIVLMPSVLFYIVDNIKEDKEKPLNNQVCIIFWLLVQSCNGGGCNFCFSNMKRLEFFSS